MRTDLVLGFVGVVALAGCRAEERPADSSGGTTSGESGATSATGGTSSNTGGVGIGGATSSTGGSASLGGAGGGAGAGGTASGTGGTAMATGGSASGAGGSAGAGGEGGAGEAGADFPWPEVPATRGSVTDVESGDLSAAGCCTRVPGEDNYDAEYCPPGVLTYEVHEVPGDPGEGQSVSFSFEGTRGSFNLQVIGLFPEATRLGAMVTELPPPAGIIDLSPVLWLGAESGELPEAGVAVSMIQTNYGKSSVDPGGIAYRVYYSTDGVEFEALAAMNPGLIGPTAVLEQPGFFVAGVGPGVVECHGP